MRAGERPVACELLLRSWDAEKQMLRSCSPKNEKLCRKKLCNVLPARLRSEHCASWGGWRRRGDSLFPSVVLFKFLNDWPWDKTPSVAKVSSSAGGVLGILGHCHHLAYWGETGEGEDKHIRRASMTDEGLASRAILWINCLCPRSRSFFRATGHRLPILQFHWYFL